MRKRQLTRVESMHGGCKISEICIALEREVPLVLPHPAHEEQSSTDEQSTLEESILIPRVYSSDEEPDSE